MYDPEEPTCPTCGGRLLLDSVSTTEQGAVAVEASCGDHGEMPLMLVIPETLPPDDRK